ncbi:MAG: Nramp family divalent metal transporter [Candidatus Roizmanbacteria bacterium]|nr:Nramp family divalent metal transporter [Candidatus Roizmanbacteria bacterium]
MKKLFRIKFLLYLLAVMGPGLVTAFADNDAGGVATYSVAAAKFGYQILFTLIPITVVLFITQEIGARIALASGKGLADLIRERHGVIVSLMMLLLVFFVNFGVILQDMSGLKSALQLFGLDYRIYLPLLLVFLFIFLVKSSYKKTERLFFVLILFYLSYLFSAVLVKPDWGHVFKSIVIPQGKMSFDLIYTSVAVLGTTVTAWGQFVIASSIKDKKLTANDMKISQFEVVAASIISNTFTMFMMVAVAATIFTNGLHIGDAAEASIAIRPLAGDLAGILFGVGLLVAGFLGCAIVPLSTAYMYSELFGYEGSLDQGLQKSKFFYGFFVFQIVLASIFVMQPKFSLFQITLYADFLNGMILPVIFVFLYRFANNPEIMGKYKNSKMQNIVLITCGVVVSLAVLFGLVGKIFNLA